MQHGFSKYFFFIGLTFSLIKATHATQLNCYPIEAVPTTINKPGNYCLQNDVLLHKQENAVTILSSGVVFDLQGYSIKTLIQDPGTRLFGIYSLDKRDITIINGTIEGFMYGIYLSDSQSSSAGPDSSSGGYIIKNMKLINNFFRGIRLEGANHFIAKNLIQNTGGTTVFKKPLTIGIETIGPGAKVKKNVVLNTYTCDAGETVSISFSNNSSGSEAFANTIINQNTTPNACFQNTDTTNQSFGIWVGGNPIFRSNAYIRDNLIENTYYGFAFSSPTTGWYGNNKLKNIRCNYLIGSTSVNTFDRLGAIECPNDSFSLNKFHSKIINSSDGGSPNSSED